MATTSLWKIDKRLDHVIDYATNEEKTKNNFYKETEENFYSIRQTLMYVTNPDKTEKQFYTTGINCKVENAIKQMIATKKKYKKEKGILAFHGYQSFEEGEVTPEIAHEIGIKLAEEMWGDRFEVVVSTHLNTNHIHNHFVVNSVSFKDGKKYYSNLENTALLRKTSDDLCDEYGLKVLGEKECKSGVNFENFYRKSLKNSDYYIFAKEDLDYAISHAYTLKEFEKMLVSMGYNYSYRAGKLSIRREPYKRNIRVERAFGEEYSVDRIRERICNNPIRKINTIPLAKSLNGRYFFRKGSIKNRVKPKGIRALYYYYCYLLKVYPKRNIQYKLTPEMRKEVKKMNEYSELARFLDRYNISTDKELEVCNNNLENNLRTALKERNKLYYKRKNMVGKENKDEINNKIEVASNKVTKIRNEIKLCNKIKTKVPTIKEQLKKFGMRENEKAKGRKEKKVKKKKKDYYR